MAATNPSPMARIVPQKTIQTLRVPACAAFSSSFLQEAHLDLGNLGQVVPNGPDDVITGLFFHQGNDLAHVSARYAFDHVSSGLDSRNSRFPLPMADAAFNLLQPGHLLGGFGQEALQLIHRRLEGNLALFVRLQEPLLASKHESTLPGLHVDDQPLNQVGLVDDPVDPFDLVRGLKDGACAPINHSRQQDHDDENDQIA